MEPGIRTTERTEGARLGQSNWGELSLLQPMHCEILSLYSVLTILRYESMILLPPVPRKAHFTKQETDVERLRIFPRLIAKW